MNVSKKIVVPLLSVLLILFLSLPTLAQDSSSSTPADSSSSSSANDLPPDFPTSSNDLVDPNTSDFSSDIFSNDFGTDASASAGTSSDSSLDSFLADPTQSDQSSSDAAASDSVAATDASASASSASASSTSASSDSGTVAITDTSDSTSAVEDTVTGPKDSALFWISFLSLLLIFFMAKSFIAKKEEDVF